MIVTLYNREDFIAQTLDTILAQSEPSFELLIWDDGSTDGSSNIAKEYASRDERVRYVWAENQGFTKALREAIAKTTAPLLGWIDSDDMLHPEALARTIEALGDPSVGLAYTHYSDIDSEGKILGLGRRCSIPYSRERMLIDFMTFHFRLIRRSCYEQVGGIDLNFPCAQDYDLCLKLSEVAEVCAIPEPLYYYRHHPQSISKQKRVEQIECSRMAVERALVRRGMSEEWDLEVEIKSIFRLRKKLNTLPHHTLPQVPR